MTNKINNNKKKAVRKENLIIVAICVAMITVTMCTILTKASRENSELKTCTIIVRSGETLSSIASTYCSERSVSTAVSDIIAINNMTSTVIYAGQELLIPIY